MKTILTTITFAIAVMVFAFNATPSYANEETNRKAKNAFTKPAEWMKCSTSNLDKSVEQCNEEFRRHFSEIDPEVRDVVVAYMGARFCLVHPEAEICNNNWWSSEENEGEVPSLSEDELDKRLASVIDYCKRAGNCLTVEWGEESETALTTPLRNTKICKSHPDLYFCPGSSWFNEDAESRDGSGGRDIADSGEEGSTSAAGVNE